MSDLMCVTCGSYDIDTDKDLFVVTPIRTAWFCRTCALEHAKEHIDKLREALALIGEREEVPDDD